MCFIFQVFVVTLCVYPSVTVLVSSESRGNGHPWNDVYFIPVTNYLIFNSGDYLGRILAGLIEWVNIFQQFYHLCNYYVLYLCIFFIFLCVA